MSETSTDVATLRIEIAATPARELSPNFHGHWRARHQAAKELHKAAYWAAHDAPSPVIDAPTVVSWVIYWEKGRKRMDDDNALAACKHAQDGIALALARDDKTFRLGTIDQRRDPDGRGYMVAVLSGAARNPATGTGGTGEDER